MGLTSGTEIGDEVALTKLTPYGEVLPRRETNLATANTRVGSA